VQVKLRRVSMQLALALQLAPPSVHSSFAPKRHCNRLSTLHIHSQPEYK
jgi:hypothetical protein